MLKLVEMLLPVHKLPAKNHKSRYLVAIVHPGSGQAICWHSIIQLINLLEMRSKAARTSTALQYFRLFHICRLKTTPILRRCRSWTCFAVQSLTSNSIRLKVAELPHELVIAKIVCRTLLIANKKSSKTKSFETRKKLVCQKMPCFLSFHHLAPQLESFHPFGGRFAGEDR